MTRDEAMDRLKVLSDEKVKRLAIREGAGADQFGVKLGDIRKLADEIKADHALALELWATGNVDARLLAILLLKPKQISADDLDAMVRSNRVMQVSDWLNGYVVKKHPQKETLRQAWMQDDHPVAARAGWSLTAERIAKNAEGLDLGALLDRIEAQMVDAAPEPKWTMNMALAQIGINHPQHRERALAIGEALGVYRDYPTPAGCTSPFAPEWIGEMVRRQERISG